MLESRPLRRVLAAGAAAGLAAGLALLPAGGAYAGVQSQFAAAGQANADYTGSTTGASCQIDPGDTQSPVSTIKTLSDGTKHASVDLDAHFTNTANTADTVHVTGHVDSTLTLDKRGKDLRSFDFGAGGKVKIVHSIAGSECAASGEVFGETIVQFTEHKLGWFYLTRDTTKPNSLSFFLLVNVKSGQLKTLDFYAGDKSHATSRVKLKPGTYAIEQCQVGVMASDPGGGIALRTVPRKRGVTLTTTLHGAFKPI